jgi:hypothetical protein
MTAMTMSISSFRLFGESRWDWATSSKYGLGWRVDTAPKYPDRSLIAKPNGRFRGPLFTWHLAIDLVCLCCSIRKAWTVKSDRCLSIDSMWLWWMRIREGTHGRPWYFQEMFVSHKIERRWCLQLKRPKVNVNPKKRKYWEAFDRICCKYVCF